MVTGIEIPQAVVSCCNEVCYPYGWKHGKDGAVNRRDFITLLGSAATWPLAARAQQHGGMRRVAVLMGLAESDPGTMAYVQELKRGLAAFGWSDGNNLEVAYRYAGGNPERARLLAKELVALQPDLIVGHTTPVAAALHQATRTIPVMLQAWHGPART